MPIISIDGAIFSDERAAARYATAGDPKKMTALLEQWGSERQTAAKRLEPTEGNTGLRGLMNRIRRAIRLERS